VRQELTKAEWWIAMYGMAVAYAIDSRAQKRIGDARFWAGQARKRLEMYRFVKGQGIG
jgi:hypothetical protein